MFKTIIMRIFSTTFSSLGINIKFKNHESLSINHSNKTSKTVQYLPFKSTLGIKDNFKSVPIKCGQTWIEEKRREDNNGGLWRVRDQLYDFTNFIEKHPGGTFWLQCTKGTDITELFETHHISSYPETLLSRYRVKSACEPRNSPYTFEDDGFYRTLKKRVRSILPKIPETATSLSKFYADSLYAALFILAIATYWSSSYVLAILAGLAMALCVVCGHNFYHRRDNFRMHYFDLGMGSFREWRILHIFSHHIFTNTTRDFEMVGLEPVLMYLPHQKICSGYIGSLLYPAFFTILYPLIYVRRWIYAIVDNKGVNRLSISLFVPMSIPFAMCISSMLVGEAPSIFCALYWWIFISLVNSCYFGLLSIGAGHHQPDIFHDGDTPRSLKDWGMFQLDTVKENSSAQNSGFLVLTHFGEHALHHLFPTLDHGQLPYLYKCLEETSLEFGIVLKKTSLFELIKGNFKQLVRQTPNPSPPGI